MMPQKRGLGALAIAFILVCCGGMFAQQSPGPGERPIAVIRFFSEVNPGTASALMRAIDSEYKAGTRRFAVLISSSGGDVLSGFTAYNYLKGLQIELTTFNIGNVDSAATLLFCAGKKRFSVPNARFLLHEGAVTFNLNVPLVEANLRAQIMILEAQNQMMARVLAETVDIPLEEAQRQMRASTLLTPEQAKKIGLVNEIKAELLEPGSQLVLFDSGSKPSLGPSPNSPTPISQISTLPPAANTDGPKVTNTSSAKRPR